MENINSEIEDAYKPCTWNKIRQQVKQLNPNLACIIDDLSPDDDHHFYTFDYKFGADIIQDGILHIPFHEGMVSLKDAPKKVQEQISYNFFSNPVTFVLKNSLELFIKVPGRIMPISLVKAGGLFGLSHVLDKDSNFYPEVNLWGMTSGVRSIFFLPKISLSIAHQRLKKKFHLSTHAPTTLLDHFYIFKDIVNTMDNKNSWETSLLFFNKKWFEHNKDPAWKNFFFYLQNEFIKNTSYYRNEYIFNLIYSQIHHKYGSNPSYYISNTAKYLIQLSLGVLPGFIPATDNDLAPIDVIQNAYINEYNLNYAPIIMQPGFLDKDYPIYASLQHNGAIDLNKKSSSRKSILTDLVELHQLMQQYQYTLKKQEMELSISALTAIGTDIEYKYFHGHDVEGYSNILSTKDLPELDSRFLKDSDNKTFPFKAHFLNGCIQINSLK